MCGATENRPCRPSRDVSGETRRETREPSRVSDGRITALKDLLMLAGKRKGKLIASCLLLILNAGLAVIPFLLVYRLLLGLFNPLFNLWKMWYLVAAIPVVYIIANALLICAYDLSHRAAFEILYEIRLRLGERMVQMPLGYYAGKNTGEFETVMNESVERLEFFLAHHFPEIITTIFVPIVLAVFLFVLDWRMAIASTTLPLLALGVIIFSGIRWPEMVEKYITAQSMVNSTIVEYIQGIAAIKAFNQTAESFRRFQKNMAFWRDSLFKWNEETALPFTVYQTLITSSLVVIIPTAVWLYRLGTLGLEMLLLFLLLGPLFSLQFMRIYQFLRYYLEEKECMLRVNQLLLAPVLPVYEKKEMPSGFDIAFHGVSFSYEDDAGYALRNITFQLPQGSVCALVGPSGAGKTTVARLIPRFWDVSEGEILIGGCNIKHIPVEMLLSYVSLVFQDVFLFNDTVLENIRLAKPEAGEEEVKAAAMAARCDEFIEKLPQGYQTAVGERGVKLSAGEKQRISIARALIKDAPVIILDEATAFLDPENEHLLQEAVGNLIRGKTVIIIAHRLSTITGADLILVLEKGIVVEQGCHEELLKNRGLYSKMWEIHTSALGWGIGRQGSG